MKRLWVTPMCTLQHRAAQEDLEWKNATFWNLHIEKTISNTIQNYI